MWTFVCAPLFTVNVTVIKVELETLVVVILQKNVYDMKRITS